MFKVNNKDSRTTPMVFIVNFEHISHITLMFLLLTLNMQLSTSTHVTGCFHHQLLLQNPPSQMSAGVLATSLLANNYFCKKLHHIQQGSKYASASLVFLLLDSNFYVLTIIINFPQKVCFWAFSKHSPLSHKRKYKQKY